MFSTFRRIGAALASFSAIAGALVNSAIPCVAAENKPVPVVVCIEYVGKWSDKPIAPIVIAHVRPARETLVGLLQPDTSPDFIHLHLFPENEARRLAEEIGKCAGPMPAASTSSIVRITVQGLAAVSRSLAADDARKVLKVFDHFQSADAEAGKELKSDLATFQMRSRLN